jgi:ascorbate-specific PTS system EIIC-type component UlaA
MNKTLILDEILYALALLITAIVLIPLALLMRGVIEIIEFIKRTMRGQHAIHN